MKITIEPVAQRKTRPDKRKATDEQIIESYTRLGNVWKVGVELGMCGQSVHERIKKLGFVDQDQWTNEQLDILWGAYQDRDSPVDQDALVISLGKLASNISRKARELGLSNRHRNLSTQDRLAASVKAKVRLAQNGHTRGYRELRICKRCNKLMDVNHSSNQQYCSMSCSRFVTGNQTMHTRGKGGKREDLGGQYFRSTYEANYARYLNYLIQHGSDIKSWQFEPETFRFDKIKRGTQSYTPDFKVVFMDGRCEYHEVKGWDYPRGITARKRFIKYYPHLTLVLIDKSFFLAVKKQGMDKLISGWE